PSSSPTRRSSDLFDIVAFLFSLLFGKSDGGHLWLAIGTARNVVVVQGQGIFTGQFFYTNSGLMRSFVGQPRSAGHIADGINSFHAGLAGFLINFDGPFFVLNTDLIQTYIFHIARNAHGRKHHIGFDHFLIVTAFDGYFYAVTIFFYLLNGAAGADVHAFFLKDLAQFFAHIFILNMHQRIFQLYDRYFRTNSIIEIGKLNTYGAGPDDHHFLRFILKLHGFFGVDDRFAINLDIWQLPGTSTRGDNKILCLYLFTGFTLFINNLDLVLRFKDIRTFKDLNFIVLH